MSNYVKTKDFAAADALASGNAAKAVKGADFGLEFDNIASMSGTKIDAASAASLLSVLVTGSSPPANGLYLPAANTVGIAANGAAGFKVSQSAIQGYGPTAAALVDMTPDSGSFSSTTSGAFVCTFTWKWRRQGGIVCLWTDAGSGAQTSILSSLTLNSLPSAIQPAATRSVIGGTVTCFPGTIPSVALATITNSANFTINPPLTLNAGNPSPLRDATTWNASGAGGASINAGCLFVYPL